MEAALYIAGMKRWTFFSVNITVITRSVWINVTLSFYILHIYLKHCGPSISKTIMLVVCGLFQMYMASRTVWLQSSFFTGVPWKWIEVVVNVDWNVRYCHLSSHRNSLREVSKPSLDFVHSLPGLLLLLLLAEDVVVNLGIVIAVSFINIHLICIWLTGIIS